MSDVDSAPPEGGDRTRQRPRRRQGAGRPRGDGTRPQADGARPPGDGAHPQADGAHPRVDGTRPGRDDRRREHRPHDPAELDRRQVARVARTARARHAVVVPPLHYPAELPVSARRDDIAAAIAGHQVVIVAGATGSGKTTQLPKILLDLGRGRDGQIGHTQPRRIAARTVAERIAEEVGTELGQIVGYQVRFTDTSSDETLVRVMTDGILLAQIQRDPMLRAYDTLIIDEAHERSLNIDFILGYLTRLLPQRPDLKVVITSATIDSERFAAHFAGPPSAEHPDGVPAPVVEVTGRTYPVEIRYRPLSPQDVGAGEDDDVELGTPLRRAPASGRAPGKGTGTRAGTAAGTGAGKESPREDRDLMTAIADAVDELCAEGPGDILVFLSGEREIRDAEDALTSALGPRVTDPRHPDAVEIVPLYARLSSAEQHRVFEPHGTRRVVLATNVAETSLTVPGIRYVVDPGTARISRFSKATKVQRLPIEPISQASANQRSGRCGRVAEGIAIRLYSEEDFRSRPEYTEPEILRTSLAAVILQMVAVGVAATPDDVARFPFVEPPDVRSIRDGVQLLTELGALETRVPGPSRPRDVEPTADDAAAPGEARTPAAAAAGAAAPAPVQRLTETGRALAQLPMDPRLARMIVEGGRRGVAREVMVIAAALSIQDPRERPAEQRPQADQLHARFADPSSDFLGYLNLWQYVKDSQRELSGSAFRRLCRAEHLNYLRLREWQDVVTQLREMAKPLGIRVEPPRHAPGTTSSTTTSAPTTPATAASTTTTAPAPPRRRTAPGAAQDTLAADDAGTTSLRLDWDADRIHVSVLSGLLSQIGMQEVTEVRATSRTGTKPPPKPRKGGRNEYVGARGVRFAIFPGSPLSRKPPAWVMAGELVETSRLWARDAARIQPEWAEELAAHLVKRTYSEPTWSSKQGAAMAFERVLLYGVPIVAQRRVLYAKVDPEHARELFIRHALVEGGWTTHHAFFHDNRALLAQAESLEHRARRRDLVVDDDALFAFYDERVPADVVSSRHFDTWWKGARRESPDLLTFTLEMLVADDADVSEADFPSVWPQGDLELPLTYQFQPGTDADGVTVHIPLVVLNRVRPEGFDWMVPGLREELVVALVRSLPKPVRVQLVPAPDVAREVVAWIDTHMASWADTVRAGDLAPSFHEAVASAVRALRDVVVPEDAWDDERLPAHLRMTFRVEEERSGGAVVLDEGKDLVALQRRLAARTQDAVRVAVRSAVRDAMREAARDAGSAGGSPAASPGGTVTGGAPVGEASAGGRGDGRATAAGAAGSAAMGTPLPPPVAERTGVTTWPTDLPDGRLPEVVETVAAGGVVVRGYPALVEEPGPRHEPTVALRVLADARQQAAAHRRGVRRLLLVETALATSRVTTRWSGTQALTLAASPYRTTEALVADVQLAAVDALIGDRGDVRDAAAYRALRDTVRPRLEDTVHRVVTDLVAVLTAARELDAAVRSSTSLALLNTLQDVREQAAALVHDGFVAETGAARLPHLTRYLRAAQHRVAKAADNPHRDAELAWKVHDLEGLLDAARTRVASGPVDPARRAALTDVRWMIEELRVSLFAQQLGTPAPVSEKRVRAALAAI